MKAMRLGRLGFLGLIVVALLGAGLIAACSSIDDDLSNGTPTTPTPGGDPSQRGLLAINPSEFTFTAQGWSGGGIFFYLELTGGRPPYTWANSWTQMGLLIPLDEQGLGYATRAKYVLRDFNGFGDDFISVRDQTGAIATCKFTKVIEDPDPLPALTITPSAATIVSGSSISLLATGGGPYEWTTSFPPPASGFNQGPPIMQDFANGQRVTLFTEAFTGPAPRLVTVTVKSGSRIGTAVITVEPTGP